jgi:D-glycero-D-manno-heptose 1,7-bisphosphate phosphatase
VLTLQERLRHSLLILDRDGVINRRVVGDYVRAWEDFEFLPGAVEAVVTLSQLSRSVVVVTNQQGVGKGLLSEGDLREIHRRMSLVIEGADGRLDGVLFCPHLATAACGCRKPGTQLVQDWLRWQPQLAPHDVVVVGDSASDIAMGRALHDEVLCVLVSETGAGDGPAPDLIVPTLSDFAALAAANPPEERTP